MTFADIKKLFEQHCKDNDVCPHCAEVDIEVWAWHNYLTICGTQPVRITGQYEDEGYE